MRLPLPRRRAGLLAALVAALPAALLLAADAPKPAAPAAPADDLQLIPREAGGFVHVKVGELYGSPLGQKVLAEVTKANPKALELAEKEIGFPPANIETVTVIWPTLNAEKSLESAAFVINLKKPVAKKDLLAALTKGEDDREGLPENFYKLKNGPAGATLHLARDRRFTVFTTEQARNELFALLLKGRTVGGLDEPLELAAQGHLVSVGFRPADLRHLIPDGDVPPPVRDVLPVMDVQTVSAVADLGSALTLDLRLRYADKGDAAKAEKAARSLLDLAKTGISIGLAQIPKEQKVERAAIEALDAMIKAAKLQRSEALVRADFSINPEPVLEFAAAQVAGGGGSVSASAARQRDANNLKQIALAMHNYESTYGHFPPAAICDKQGKPLLSWRVAILPYIEQDNLYQQFRLDEPWDSPANKKLLEYLPNVYVVPNSKQLPGQYLTHYRVFVGGGALFDMRKGVKFAEITDGTSNTLMVVETAEGVPWTKPEDIPYDPKKPLPKFGDFFDKGFNAAMADGSVRFLPKDIKEQTLRAIITRAGGEVIDGNDF
jgi:hypothetical protein